MQESIMQSKKAEQRLRDAKYLHVGSTKRRVCAKPCFRYHAALVGAWRSGR